MCSCLVHQTAGPLAAVAARLGRSDVVIGLLDEHGVDVNGYYDVDVCLLCQTPREVWKRHDDDTDHPYQRHVSLMHMAACSGSVSLMQELVRRGGNPLMTNDVRPRGLAFCIWGRVCGGLRVLCVQKEQSPLLFACFMGDAAMAEYLIGGCGADPNGADKVRVVCV
jgi:hypothetical protein